LAATGAVEKTLDGIYRLLAVSPRPGQTPSRSDIDVLEIDKDQYELLLPARSRPRSGVSVRVTGTLTERRGVIGAQIIEVSRIEVVTGAALEPAPPTTGTTQVLVILAYWTSPDSVTPARAREQIFVDDNAWVQEASYGQLQLAGDVTNWLSIPVPPNPCNTNHIMSQARSAAQSAGLDYTAYNRTMVYFPHSADCDFGGLAFISDQRSWINGFMDRRVTVHEQGHNYGLYHAHSYTCRDGAGLQVVLAHDSACTSSDYGDPFDAMGASNLVGHFSAPNKNALGWLGARTAVLPVGGSVTLSPFEMNTTATLAARVNTAGNRTYWIEYRRAIGFDGNFPAGAVNGVLIHMVDPAVTPNGPELLDLRIGSSVDFFDAALGFGTSWRSPENLRITVGSGSATGVTVSLEQVSNDPFADAISIGGVSAQTTGSNGVATKEPGEPNHAGNSGGRSVWYRWTAPASGRATFDTSGSAFNTLLAVYSGGAVNALTQVGANDDVGGGNLTSSITFDAIVGTAYQVAVDGFNGAGGALTLRWNLVIPPPPNDAFAGAEAITGATGQVSGNNLAATKQSGEPDHAGTTGGKSVWYRWTAPTSGNASFNTAQSTFDTVLAVYTGATVNALTALVANDDVGNGDLSSKVTFVTTGGATYQIAVDGYAGESGNLKLGWALGPLPPVNDAFADAQQLSGASVQSTGQNVAATKQTGEPNHAGNAGGRSVWYRWSAPTGGSVVLDTFGSDFDTLLAVYTGSAVGSLVLVAANDDFNSNDLRSKVTFTAASNTTYQIAVDGYSGASGNIKLKLAGARRTMGVADFDGNRSTDISVFRPSAGSWLIQNQPTEFIGTSGDVPVPCDYDGDGATDTAVFRPSVGGWYVSGHAPEFFGLPGDVAVPGDFNGDGRCERAVFRPAVGGWYIQGQSPVFFGLDGDIPVPGDYDGDGTTDVAVFRPAVGGWYRNGAAPTFFGLSGDVPVPGDYDGNGTTDVAIFRSSVGGWYVNGQAPQFLGLSGDVPQPGDYDGNGTTDLAVYRSSIGAWFIGGQAPVYFGTTGDLPVPLPSAIRSALYP